MKSWKWQLEYGHSSTSQLRISILASTGRVQVKKKCHENSGGYALCLLYIVMCAILRVVAYFLSVHCLCGFMCGTFSFEGIKKFLT